MAVSDRWHRDPQDAEQLPPCKCRNGRGGKLYPSRDHLTGKRWQVRWRDPDTGKQVSRNFEYRDGKDPDRHADAFDGVIQGQLVTRTYVDPRAGEVTFREYAEEWRAARTHGETSAALMEGRFRNHVYPAIGRHPVALLAHRPSLVAAWAASLTAALPAAGSRRLVVGDVSAVFQAAMLDGIIRSDPTKTQAVMPARDAARARPFTQAEVDAIGAKLPARFAVLARLGAGTGMREMELAALGTGDIQFLGKRPRVRVERQLKYIGGQLVFAPLKNRRPHDVPLSPGLALLLARHLEQHPAREITLPWHDPRRPKEHGRPVTVKLVLRRADGIPATRGAIHGAWAAAAEKAAGKGAGWNLHRLRHTYASMQLRKGVDVVRVAAAMGDTVDVVVKTYAHLMPEDDGDADLRSAVDDFFAPCAPDVPSEDGETESGQAGGG